MRAVKNGARGVIRVPRLDFFTQILGVRWRILADHRLPRDTDGDCNRGLKRIRVHPSNPFKKRFETLHHEWQHAAFDHLDEAYVADSSADFAEIVYRPDVLAFLGLQLIPDSPQRD
jgi:hypothetical protein